MMKEPEVSLRLAIYYIKNGLTKENVRVSLDGAHVKIKGRIQFDVPKFMNKQGFKHSGENGKWQGEYVNEEYEQRIIVSAQSGIGDVNVVLPDGGKLFVESKKGCDKKGNPEYPLIREAIGQLMTNENVDENTRVAVAVPYYEKTLQLARKWAECGKIKNAQIRFLLVKEDGDVIVL